MPESRCRTVASRQETAHPALRKTISRHRATPHRRQVRAEFAPLFAQLDRIVETHGGGVIIDSGCGTGESSVALACAHPDALVLGCDKDRTRLQRARSNPVPRTNLAFVRANLPDLWTHARRARWRIRANLLLYPNPWPKPRHLMRRWHAHPAMEDIVALGGRLELRTNWRCYAEEFACTIREWCAIDAIVTSWQPRCPVSAFERKYLHSDHALFRVVVQLPRSVAP